MSFGYSAGDAILLTQLAWKTVQGARNACGEHDELTREVTSLHKVLAHLQSEISNPESPVNRFGDERRRELGDHMDGCDRILRVIDSIITKYNALGDEKRSGKKLWQKIRFGNGEMQDLAEIRLKISTHTSAITMTLNLLSLGSQGRVEQQLSNMNGDVKGIRESVNWLTARMTAGNGEGSVMTSYADDDRAFWREIRRELVKEGYPSTVLQRHKGIIKAYVKELGDRGVLDESSGDFAFSTPTSYMVEDRSPPSEVSDNVGGKETQNVDNIPPESESKTPVAVLETPAGVLKENTSGDDSPTFDEQRTSSRPQTVQMEEVVDEEFAYNAHSNVDTCDAEPTEDDAGPLGTVSDKDQSNLERRFTFYAGPTGAKPVPEKSNVKPPWNTSNLASLNQIQKNNYNGSLNPHGIPTPTTLRLVMLHPVPAVDNRSRLEYENDLRGVDNPVISRQAPLLTEEDLKVHDFPVEYSLRHWDPRVRPLVVGTTVFDLYSLTAWMMFSADAIGIARPHTSNIMRDMVAIGSILGLLGERNEVTANAEIEEGDKLYNEFVELVRKAAAPIGTDICLEYENLVESYEGEFVDIYGRGLAFKFFKQAANSASEVSDFLRRVNSWQRRVQKFCGSFHFHLTANHPASHEYECNMTGQAPLRDGESDPRNKTGFQHKQATE